MSNPEDSKFRPRAVFSQEDFQLLYNALSHYIFSKRIDDQEQRKCSQLLHRLTRIKSP